MFETSFTTWLCEPAVSAADTNVGMPCSDKSMIYAAWSPLGNWILVVHSSPCDLHSAWECMVMHVKSGRLEPGRVLASLMKAELEAPEMAGTLHMLYRLWACHCESTCKAVCVCAIIKCMLACWQTGH